MLCILKGIDDAYFFSFKFLYDICNEFKDVLEELMG